MDSDTNPYAPPESNVVSPIVDRSESKPVYTPFQVALASFIGGPIAGIYTLSKNYYQLGKTEAYKNTILLGSTILLFIIWLSAIQSQSSSIKSIPLFTSIIANWIAKSAQLSRTDIANSFDYKRYSAWNIVLVIILSFVMTFIVSAPIVLILSHLNVI